MERGEWTSGDPQARLKAERDRLTIAAEIACKHWVAGSNMQDAAMAALCDHLRIDYQKNA